MVKVDDGKGRGFTAEVNAEQQVVVRAISETVFAHISESRGQAYSWSSGTYNPAAGDTILLVKNTGSEELHFERIWLSTDVDTRVIIHLPTTEVTPTGTAIAGINLNTGNSNVAEATAIRDETDNTQGSIIWSGEIMAADSPYAVELSDGVILAKNKSIGVDYVADVAACDVVIFGDFE